MLVGRLLSYWEVLFSGAMLNFGRVLFLSLVCHIESARISWWMMGIGSILRLWFPWCGQEFHLQLRPNPLPGPEPKFECGCFWTTNLTTRGVSDMVLDERCLCKMLQSNWEFVLLYICKILSIDVYCIYVLWKQIVVYLSHVPVDASFLDTICGCSFPCGFTRGFIKTCDKQFWGGPIWCSPSPDESKFLVLTIHSIKFDLHSTADDWYLLVN